MCMNCWLLKWFFFCPHSHYSHVTKILHEEHHYYKLLEVFYPPKSVSSSLSFSILVLFLLYPFSSLSSSFCLLGARPSHLRPHTARWHPRNCKVRSDVKTNGLYLAISVSVTPLPVFCLCFFFFFLCHALQLRSLLRFLLYCHYYLRSKCRNFFYYSYSNCQVCRTFLCFSYLHCIYFLFYIPSLSWFLTIIDCIERTLHSYFILSLSVSFKMIKLFLSLYQSVDIRLMRYSRNRQPIPASTGLISLIPCTWPDPEVKTKCVRVSTHKKKMNYFCRRKRSIFCILSYPCLFFLHLSPLHFPTYRISYSYSPSLTLSISHPLS